MSSVRCPTCGGTNSVEQGIRDITCQWCGKAISVHLAALIPADPAKPTAISERPLLAPHLESPATTTRPFEITAYSAGKIGCGMIIFLPFMIGVMLFVAVAISGAVIGVTKLFTDEKYPAILLCGAALSPILVSLLIRHMLESMSASRLAIERDDLVVRGLVTSGFGMAFGVSERRIPIADIAEVGIGDQIRLHERFLRQNRMVKRGRLVVRDRSGREFTLHFADRVFDPDRYRDFIAELEQRGVTVTYNF